MTYLRDLDLPTVQSTPATGRPMIIDSFAGGGGASTAPSLTDARAVLADITHHDARTIRHASLRVLLQGTDPTERQDARAALQLIRKGTIR